MPTVHYKISKTHLEKGPTPFSKISNAKIPLVQVEETWRYYQYKRRKTKYVENQNS